MNEFFQKNNAFFVYFPGLVILVFGMLALHSTVSLIEARASLQKKHYTYINSALMFQNDYYEFSELVNARLSGDDHNNFDIIKEEFSNINDDFFALRKVYMNEASDIEKVNPDNAHTLYLIGQGLKDIAATMILYEQVKGTNEEKGEENHLKGEIYKTFKIIFSSQNLILKKHRDIIDSEEFKIKELWLYWSVIFMGLSGFVLVLLNGQKLQDLKSLNTERLKTFDTMQKRLAALEIAKDGFLMVEADGTLTYFNKSLEQMLGLQENTRELYYNKDWREIFTKEDSLKMDEHALPILREKGHWIDTFEITRRDGSVVHTEMSSTLLPDGGMIGTVQDISARHKAEMDKNDMEAQFYQAQKMEAIGRLAGGIAHDFNNILAAMNGYAEFLIDDLDEESDQHKFAQNILLAGTQAKDLVDQVLTFSRRSDSVQEPVNIVSIINEVRTMIDATIPKSIELTTNIPSYSIPIFANSTKISQIMMNLCVNAIDAMDGGHGELGMFIEIVNSDDIDEVAIHKNEFPNPKETPLVRIYEETPLRTKLILGHVAKHMSYAKITVSDSGTGMSKQIMEHVFEPFFTTKSVDEGTGLGLATVHGVVVSHIGMLVINSELGKGTVFEIYFPIYKSNADQELDDNNVDHEEVSYLEGFDTQKRILVVEDQDFVLKMTMKMLDRMEHEAHYAVNGMEGLDIIRENPDAFDLIISDYNMPKMSGLEMAQQIYLDFPDLPIILLSGYSEEKIQELLKDHPSIKAILRKPVTKEKLEKTIKMVFDKNQQAT
ncbi:MAG: hybrid sensor histidine kinase/response regulator [Alphaproteobacteria bacterium]